MSKQLGKTLLRSAKNYTKGYSDIQIKVRQATSNDPWGPSGSLMADISQSTFNHRDYVEIMEMVDKRLNDSGKNWRHVFKALTLLDYLLHTGSEAVITYARENIHVIKTLKEFQFIDDDGKDQGANVRQKCKDITALLADETRLREERQTRADMRGRMTGLDQFPGIRSGGNDQSAFYNEDRELQKALEESRKTARQDESRRTAGDKEEEELQRALELSEKEAIERRMRERDQAAQEQPIGGEASKKDNIIDFFGGLDDSTPANPYAQQQQQQQQQQPTTSFDPFAGFGGSDPFAQQQQQFQQQYALQQQQQMQLQQQMAQQQMAQQQMLQQQQMQPQFAAAQGGNPFGGNPFGGNAGGASTIQQQLTGDNNALARGSGPIDPFASLSSGKPNNSQSNPFGGSPDPFAGPNQQAGSASLGGGFGSGQGMSAQNTGGGFGQPGGMQNLTPHSTGGGFGSLGTPGQQVSAHNTGGPMGGYGMSAQGISQHNTGGGFGGGGGFGSGQGISQHNTGPAYGSGFGNQSTNMGGFGQAISQHNTGSGGFNSPNMSNANRFNPASNRSPNDLVNLDATSLKGSSAASTFGLPAAKNPFQSASANNKFQWENPKPTQPTLAQLATHNATTGAFGGNQATGGGFGGNTFSQQSTGMPFGQQQQGMGGMQTGFGNQQFPPQQQQQQPQQPFGGMQGMQGQGGFQQAFGQNQFGQPQQQQQQPQQQQQQMGGASLF